MDPKLHHFFRQLLHQAINSAIHAVFWKMPLLWTLVALALLIWAAVHFQLY